MMNNDQFSLLYNQLWLHKDTIAKDKVVSQRDVQGEVPLPATDNFKHNEQVDKQATPSQEVATHDHVPVKEEPLIANMVAPVNAEKIVPTPSPNNLIKSWSILLEEINNCSKCSLVHTRTNVVIERGNREAKWMFVGEGPGENEDLTGKPFVGNAGELLNKMLLAMKLDKDRDVYICNVVKCRPPQNRNPEPLEISCCDNYLQSQINLVKPKIIVALGRIAAQALLKTTLATAKLRGKIHYLGAIPLIVTYHPAYLLRNPSAKKDAWADLKLALEVANSLGIKVE